MNNLGFMARAGWRLTAAAGGSAMAADGGLSFSGICGGAPFREAASYADLDGPHGTRADGLLFGIFGYPYPALQGSVGPERGSDPLLRYRCALLSRGQWVFTVCGASLQPPPSTL
jgi:hypothetical protein